MTSCTFIARSTAALGYASIPSMVAYPRRPPSGHFMCERHLLVAQVVQVSHGDRGQSLVLRLTVVLVLALENPPGGGSTQGFVGLIDGGQQFDIGAGIALREAVSSIVGGLELTVGLIAGDQPRHLGPAQAGHLLQIASQQAAGLAGLFGILLLAQNLLHPAVNLLAIFAFEPDLCAGV